jgi:membrane associated rhomboid family serine protease
VSEPQGEAVEQPDQPVQPTEARGAVPGGTLAAWFLAALLVGWQIYVAGPDATADGGTLIRYGARKPSFGFPQAPWRLAASMFLHGGWIHLVANSLLIVLWGGQICRLLGTRAFLAFFLLTGLWGSLLSDIYGPEALAVGASGGASGLVLGLLVLALLAPQRARWAGDARRWLQSSVAVLVLNSMMAFGLTGMSYGRLDHWAHTGGAVAGALLGLAASRDSDKNNRIYWLGVVLLSLALAAVIWRRGASPLG